MNTNAFVRTVLVVDDAPDSLSLISDTLEAEGINTLVALDGKQALMIAKQLRPDMILLDAIMPNIDGFETCRQLKAIPQLSSIPVIFMTGLSDTENVLKGLEVGGVDYLTKPVNPDELLARMKVHLSNARLTSSAQNALDSMGQNIFTVDENGNIIWATPQTHALLAKADMGEQWQKNVFAPKIVAWLQHKPAIKQIMPLPEMAHPVEVSLIEYRDNGEVLLKLTDADRLPGDQLLKEKLGLTTRESEVLYWLANGKTNKEISEILDMGVRTVNKHLEQLFPKLGVENRTAAAGIAIRIIGS